MIEATFPKASPACREMLGALASRLSAVLVRL
jgi:hypothetical protein